MEENKLLVGDVLKRMPLADACYQLMGQVFSESLLDHVWETNRGRGYDRKLSFGMAVELLENALLRHKGSGRASFDEAREAKQLPVSCTAVYGKLGRMPLAVSEGLLRTGAHELRKLVPDGVFANPLPACFNEFQVLVIDGKIVKRVPHLLKLLRGARAAVLGGKASVLLDVRTRLVLAMAVSGDGYADELALTRQLLSAKDELGEDPRPTLTVLDRLYCNCEIPSLCLRNSGHFIIRFGGNMKFHEDPEYPTRQFHDAQGTVITERWGWLNVREGAPLRVRQITREPRQGKVVRVITDLLDAKRYPAIAVLEVYRARWSIECVFHLVTKTFGLDRLIVTTPRGTVFQFAFCLLLYDIVQVIKLILAEQTQRPVERISSHKLLEDVQRQLTALHVMFPIPVIVSRFHTTTPRHATQVLRALQAILSQVWRPRWVKALPRPRGAPTPKRRVKGNQISVYREIQKHRKDLQRC
jgi:hypothetical protein